MRIKPVEVLDLMEAFNLALQRGAALTTSGRYTNDEDSQEAYWSTLYNDLTTQGFSHHEAARAIALMWAAQEFKGVPTPEIKAQAAARAAVAPIDRVTFEFRDPASLFLSL
jgi:hypothetical protein